MNIATKILSVLLLILVANEARSDDCQKANRVKNIIGRIDVNQQDVLKLAERIPYLEEEIQRYSNSRADLIAAGVAESDNEVKQYDVIIARLTRLKNSLLRGERKIAQSLSEANSLIAEACND